MQDIQEEIFVSKDVKIIVKEVDSTDKYTRISALEAWGEIYKLIGEKFWKMVDKAINQKVRDLLQSKFTNLPKTAPKLKVAKPPKVPKIVKTKNVMQESIKSASSQAPKNENKFITPLKNSTFSQVFKHFSYRLNIYLERS